MPPKDSLLKIRLPAELKKAAETVAAEMGESVSTVVRESIRRFLDTYGEDHHHGHETGSDARAYPVLSPSQAHALRDLIIASQKVAEEQIEYMLGEEPDSNNTEN